MAYLFLVPACLLAVVSSLRLCRLAAAGDPMLNPAARSARPAEPRHPERIDLYAAAYLAGGPERVVDLALVQMAGAGLLHLAPTGWTSVARPAPRTEVEAAILAAVGPGGQCRTDGLRRAAAEGPAVREVGERLALAGLAVPTGARAALAEAVAGVRIALLATLGLLAAALGVAAAERSAAAEALLAWFALPLVLSTGTLIMARIEVYPVTPWAAPQGQELLRALSPRRRAATGATDADLALAVALRGAGGVKDPLLRAALTLRPS